MNKDFFKKDLFDTDHARNCRKVYGRLKARVSAFLTTHIIAVAVVVSLLSIVCLGAVVFVYGDLVKFTACMGYGACNPGMEQTISILQILAWLVGSSAIVSILLKWIKKYRSPHV